MINIKYLIQRLYNFYLVLALGFSGIFILISHKFDMGILKLWDEIYILFLLFPLIIYLALKEKRKKFLFIIIMVILVYSIYFIFFSSGGYKASVYQIKLDIPFVIFIFLGILYSNFDRKEYVFEGIEKKILVLAAIGAIVGILQAIFQKEFVENIIGIEWGAWGTSTGLSIKTAGANLRSIGLLQNHVAQGDLMMLAIILLNEVKFKMKNKNKYCVMLNIVYIIGAIVTRSKSAYLGISLYIFIKGFLYIGKNLKFKNQLIAFFMIFVIIMQGIVTNSFVLYDIVHNISPKYAYGSVYLRVDYHQKINKKVSGKNILLGEGLGYNNKFSKNENKLILDSTYVYLLSNYGYLMVGLYAIVGVGILLYGLIKKQNLLLYLMMYILLVQIFFNNSINSAPTSNIYIFLVVGYLLMCIKGEKKYEKIFDFNVS